MWCDFYEAVCSDYPMLRLNQVLRPDDLVLNVGTVPFTKIEKVFEIVKVRKSQTSKRRKKIPVKSLAIDSINQKMSAGSVTYDEALSLAEAAVAGLNRASSKGLSAIELGNYWFRIISPRGRRKSFRIERIVKKESAVQYDASFTQVPDIENVNKMLQEGVITTEEAYKNIATVVSALYQERAMQREIALLKYAGDESVARAMMEIKKAVMAPSPELSRSA
jgi:hypothetical protein